MSDSNTDPKLTEQETQETEATGDTAEGKLSDAAFKNTNLFKNMAAQNLELKNKMEELLDAERKKQEAAEMKQLEAKGNYEEALMKLKAESTSKETQLRKELLETNLKFKLSMAGLTDELALRGALVGFEGDMDGIDLYIESLREQHPAYFGQQEPQQPRAQGSLAAGTPGTRSGAMDWGKAKAALSDPSTSMEELAKIDKAVKEHVKNHGKMPW